MIFSLCRKTADNWRN